MGNILSPSPVRFLTDGLGEVGEIQVYICTYVRGGADTLYFY